MNYLTSIRLSKREIHRTCHIRSLQKHSWSYWKKRKHVLFSSILLRHLIYTVNHKILLNKVEYSGARGVLLIWFQSYLHNRQQCVKINQSTSDSKTIICGVGSVLGALLFLIYINDIFLATPKVSFHLFADDTSCIFHSNKNYRNLEDEINTSPDNITNC